MVTYTKAPDWVANMAHAANLSSDTLKIALSNTAPASETPNPLTDTNGILANVTEIAYTNYGDDMTVDRVLEGVTATQTGGMFTLNANDIVITATGGALATFQYIYVFDDTVTSPADPLICVIDNEATVTLLDTESVTITWNASGIYTAA